MCEQIQPTQMNIATLQNKVIYLRAQAKEAKDIYVFAVRTHREFRLKHDNITAQTLEQLERTVERSKMFHRVLNAYLEVQHVMVTQSLRNIETIKIHIANLNPQNDNAQFVESSRTNTQKPPLPEPELYPDDKEILDPGPPELSENTPDVRKWCAKWRIVIGTILGRDIDLSASSSNDHNHINSNSNFNSNSNSHSNSTSTSMSTSNSSNINPIETLHDPLAHPPPSQSPQPQTKLTEQEFDA
ncbi:serine-leucine-rich repeat protein, partial [Reticulomyxa filosa]